MAEAIELVESKRDGEGQWQLENRHPGTMAVEVNEVDPPRTSRDPALRQGNRLAGPFDYRVVVAALQAHCTLAEHVHGLEPAQARSALPVPPGPLSLACG